MRVLVVGGSGFTGRRVLAQAPDEVELFATCRSGPARLAVQGAGATAVTADLDDPSSIELAVREVAPTHVIVVASLGFGHAPGLVAALERAGGPRTVFTSTTGIFTKLSPATKNARLEAERVISNSTLRYTILRPTMIYGRPGDRNMERLLAWLRRLPVLPVPNAGRNLHQPVHVDDVADALWSAARSPAAVNTAINLPGPEPLEFRQLIAQAGTAVGRRGRSLPVPVRALRHLVVAQERLVATPKLRAEQVDRLVENKAFSPEEARSILGIEPRSFAAGIRTEADLLHRRVSA